MPDFLLYTVHNPDNYVFREISMKRVLLFATLVLFMFPGCESDGKLTDQTVIIPESRSPTLQWQRHEPGKKTQTDAIEYCTALTLEDKTDWRLPTIQELFTLIDFEKKNPAIDKALFPAAEPRYYWSSTLLKGRESSAWYVLFYAGGIGYETAMGMGYIRCVRTVE
mgnify:FL=1